VATGSRQENALNKAQKKSPSAINRGRARVSKNFSERRFYDAAQDIRQQRISDTDRIKASVHTGKSPVSDTGKSPVSER
jgi:hypothetical protein